ncbi:hypothetical protein V8C86DRAFT_2624642 [Haematococcus lacustris]
MAWTIRRGMDTGNDPFYSPPSRNFLAMHTSQAEAAVRIVEVKAMCSVGHLGHSKCTPHKHHAASHAVTSMMLLPVVVPPGQCFKSIGGPRFVVVPRRDRICRAKKIGSTEGSYITSKKSRRVDILKELGLEETNTPEPATTAYTFTASPEDLKSGNWIELLPDVEAFFQAAGKDVKAFPLAAGRTVVLYRYKGGVYCSDVNSTAYKFPMIDAKLLDKDGQPAVEVPLDGTIYCLRTGKVLSWCPGNTNPLFNILAGLKRSSNPEDLLVFPTHITPTGALRIKFT